MHKASTKKLHRKVFDRIPNKQPSQRYTDDAEDSDEGPPENHPDAKMDGKPFKHNSNQGHSHVGSWSGVMGSGASKLQSIHKWFKGESLDGRDLVKRKSDFSELAAVSVRDMVKAIGGSQDSKRNGNGAISPNMSRSTSPTSMSKRIQRTYETKQSLLIIFSIS